MWRFLIVTLALAIGLCCDAPVLSQGKGTPTVEISWYGQSFFRIVSSKGTRIVTDPHAITFYPRAMGVSADVVLMTHFHNDHTQVSVLENVNEKTVKDGSVEFIYGLKGGGKNPDWNLFDRKSFVKDKIKDLRIRSVGLFHDDTDGLKFGRTGAFVIEVDGWRICHLGDLGHLLTPEQLKKIGPVDVLMIPVGGIYTINGAEAKKVVDQVKPKEFIFPMHCGFKNKAGDIIYDELLLPAEFYDEFPKANVIPLSDDNKFLLTDLRKKEDRPRPTVVQLNYEPKEKKEKEKDKEK